MAVSLDRAKKSQTYLERRRQVYEGYRRLYPHMAVDFVSVLDFETFLSDLKSILSDGNLTASERADAIERLSFGTTRGESEIVAHGHTDHDGSRADLDMRIYALIDLSTMIR